MLLLLAGMAPAEADKPVHFINYTKAYRAAKLVQRPMLVILNPSKGSKRKPILFADVCRTKRRRKLLKDYVVAVIDTGTPHGRKVRQLFETDPLPRVVVIDKKQKHQLFHTSDKLYGQLWSQILQSYRSGQRPPRTVSSQSQSSRQSQSDSQQDQNTPQHQYCPT